MTKKVFNIKKFIVFLCVLFIICVGALIGVYFYMISAVSTYKKEVIFNVEKGETLSTLGNKLESEGLIRSNLVYKIYLKINKVNFDLEYGEYKLDKSLSMAEIVTTLSKGSNPSGEVVKVTFYEGKNVRHFARTLNEKFNMDVDYVIETLGSEEFTAPLIEKYWFIKNDIYKTGIFYPLEGYLFPDTYEFYEDATLKDIVTKMLDNMEAKLEPYKENIEKSDYSFHEILTLASVVELEAGNSTDRNGIAGVFYNRLKRGDNLGSDVTTYYAIKADDFSKGLKQSQLDSCNDYNTRGTCLMGKLPVGPICNPSIESIAAAVNPTKHSYLFFAADKNGVTYFTKTNSEHTAKVNELKRNGLWFEH